MQRGSDSDDPLYPVKQILEIGIQSHHPSHHAPLSIFRSLENRVKPGFIGRQGSSDRSFYVSFTALPTDTCSVRSYPFVFATNLLSDTALKICIARVITP